eukprot:g15471.t1
MCGKEFEDNRVPFAEWGAVKPTTPYGQVPVLELKSTTDGSVQTFAQSRAMITYVARAFDASKTLYPEHDIQKCILVDEVLGLHDDFYRAWSPSIYTSMRPTVYGYPKEWPEQAETVKRLRESFLKDELPRFLGYLKAHLEKNGGPGRVFLCGGEVTLADLTWLPQLRYFQSGIADHVPQDSLDAYPFITDYIARMLAVPQIKAWSRNDDEHEGAKPHSRAGTPKNRNLPSTSSTTSFVADEIEDQVSSSAARPELLSLVEDAVVADHRLEAGHSWFESSLQLQHQIALLLVDRKKLQETAEGEAEDKLKKLQLQAGGSGPGPAATSGRRRQKVDDDTVRGHQGKTPAPETASCTTSTPCAYRAWRQSVNSRNHLPFLAQFEDAYMDEHQEIGRDRGERAGGDTTSTAATVQAEDELGCRLRARIASIDSQVAELQAANDLALQFVTSAVGWNNKRDREGVPSPAAELAALQRMAGHEEREPPSHFFLAGLYTCRLDASVAAELENELAGAVLSGHTLGVTEAAEHQSEQLLQITFTLPLTLEVPGETRRFIGGALRLHARLRYHEDLFSLRASDVYPLSRSWVSDRTAASAVKATVANRLLLQNNEQVPPEQDHDRRRPRPTEPARRLGGRPPTDPEDDARLSKGNPHHDRGEPDHRVPLMINTLMYYADSRAGTDGARRGTLPAISHTTFALSNDQAFPSQPYLEFGGASNGIGSESDLSSGCSEGK